MHACLAPLANPVVLHSSGGEDYSDGESIVGLGSMKVSADVDD